MLTQQKQCETVTQTPDWLASFRPQDFPTPHHIHQVLSLGIPKVGKKKQCEKSSGIEIGGLTSALDILQATSTPAEVAQVGIERHVL